MRILWVVFRLGQLDWPVLCENFVVAIARINVDDVAGPENILLVRLLKQAVLHLLNVVKCEHLVLLDGFFLRLL